MFTFFHLEILRTPPIIFQHYYPSHFHLFAIQNKHKALILGCVLKPVAVDGAFENRKSGYYTQLRHKYIFNYRDSGQNVNEA